MACLEITRRQATVWPLAITESTDNARQAALYGAVGDRNLDNFGHTEPGDLRARQSGG